MPLIAPRAVLLSVLVLQGLMAGASPAAALADGGQSVPSATTPDALKATVKVKTVVGALEDHICRRAWEAPATEAEALAAAQARAHRLGANGLVDVAFDRTRGDQKAACWQRLTVRATAVVFE